MIVTIQFSVNRNKLTTVCSSLTYQTKYFSHVIHEEKEAREVITHKPVQAIIRDTSLVISICLCLLRHGSTEVL